MIAAESAAVTPNVHTFGSLLTTLRDNPYNGSLEDKRREADYVEALMKHVGLHPTKDLHVLLEQIRNPKIGGVSKQ